MNTKFRREKKGLANYMKVDKENCIACGACGWTAPDIFDQDEAGLSFNILDENTGEAEIPDMYLDALNYAADGCPADAIKIADHTFY